MPSSAWVAVGLWTHELFPEFPSRISTPCAGNGFGGGKGGGGVGGGGGGGSKGGGWEVMGWEAVGVAQMVKPALVTLTSLYHAIVSPVAINTFAGPLVPLYCVPPMVIQSQQDSVLKPGCAFTTMEASAWMVHLSLSP
jgi:hypothetical protein